MFISQIYYTLKPRDITITLAMLLKNTIPENNLHNTSFCVLILQYYSQLYIESVLTFSIEKYLVIMVSWGKDSAHSHPFSIARVLEVFFITENFPLCGLLYSIYFNRSKTKQRFTFYFLYLFIWWLASPLSPVRCCSYSICFV